MTFMHIGTGPATANIPIVVALQNTTCHAEDPSYPDVLVNARSIGDVICRINLFTDYQYDWIDPKNQAPGSPSYQVKRGTSAPFDLNGDPGYGPFAGVWENVGGSAFWGFSLTPYTDASVVATFTVSIRQGIGTTDNEVLYPTLDTATWTVSCARVAESPPGGGGCFTGNMLVLMSDGTEKPIADILAGDTVMSLNTETNKLVSASVYKTMVPRICNIYEIKLSNGKTVETTSEHPFRTADGRWANIDPTATYQPTLGGKNVTQTYVDAQLHEGMLLRGAESNTKITKIIDTGRKETVYHLSRVGSHHNFFVEGMCVHNIYDDELEDKN